MFGWLQASCLARLLHVIGLFSLALILFGVLGLLPGKLGSYNNVANVLKSECQDDVLLARAATKFNS